MYTKIGFKVLPMMPAWVSYTAVATRSLIATYAAYYKYLHDFLSFGVFVNTRSALCTLGAVALLSQKTITLPLFPWVK